MSPAHLPKSASILRKNAWGQAYRLTEDGPHYDGSPESVHEIVNWLGVEKNARWRPTGGTTYCNVYAHDLCNAMGAYVPRVWWFPKALEAIERGEQPAAIYAATVGELSANMLFRWLVAHSAAFGWRRVENMDEAQDAANRGHAVVICARRNVEAQPGHISVIVAESERCAAKRDQHGRVTVPVQSQAGGRNVEVGTGHAWWRGTEMSECGVWVHDPLSVLRDTDPLPPPPDTDRETPKSKSSDRWRFDLSSAATPIRAGEGEHTPIHLRSSDDSQTTVPACDVCVVAVADGHRCGVCGAVLCSAHRELHRPGFECEPKGAA